MLSLYAKRCWSKARLAGIRGNELLSLSFRHDIARNRLLAQGS